MLKASRRTNEESARLVSEQQASDKTQEAWCVERGIKLRTFRDWLYRSKRGEFNGAGTAGWLEVNERDVLNSACSNPASAIEVRIGLYMIRVMPDFDRLTFVDICRELAKLC
jgi:hypothetical protein